jgi:hopanoid biosynthesis associated protein HpnK
MDAETSMSNPQFAESPPLSDTRETGAVSPPGGSKRRVIVNADDFGRSEAVNRGVAEAFRRGILTSTSLVASGPAFESAVELASNLKGLAVGVHLAANEYDPVLPPAAIPRLVNAHGRFFSRARQFQRMAIDPRLRSDLFREWDAQIAKILASGINLSHMDGHGHCHAHPAAAGVVLELAKKYGIYHVRVPAEPVFWSAGAVPLPRLAEKVMLSSAVQITLGKWRGRLQFPDYFFGFSYGGRMNGAVIQNIAEGAREGVSEIMVHVGVSNDEAPGFWTGYDYVGDLKAVTACNKQEFEKQFGIRLVNHRSGEMNGLSTTA